MTITNPNSLGPVGLVGKNVVKSNYRIPETEENCLRGGAQLKTTALSPDLKSPNNLDFLTLDTLNREERTASKRERFQLEPEAQSPCFAFSLSSPCTQCLNISML